MVITSIAKPTRIMRCKPVSTKAMMIDRVRSPSSLPISHTYTAIPTKRERGSKIVDNDPKVYDPVSSQELSQYSERNKYGRIGETIQLETSDLKVIKNASR